MYVCWYTISISVRKATMRITEVNLVKKQRVEYLRHFDRRSFMYADKEPASIIQSGWAVLQGYSRQTVMLGTQSKPLGNPIPFGWYRRTSRQTRIGIQASHGQFSHAGCHRNYRERYTEGHESQGEMAVSQG